MENNLSKQNEEILDSKSKVVPYVSATDECSPIGTVVPKSMAQEQQAFNNFLKTDIEVHQFVMSRLKYKSLTEFCQAFAQEQIDAIATAIWNFEKRGNSIIIADQTGVGKGRVCAGLIRYCILHLGKQPIFFTEKRNLFSDMYRDLVDIGFDCGVPFKLKNEVEIKSEDVDIEDFDDDRIIKIIRKDIRQEGELRVEYDFEEDFGELKTIFNEENSDILDEIIELYREFIRDEGFSDINYIKNSNYKKEVEQAVKNGRYLVEPFFISSEKVKINDKEGNILYEQGVTEIKRFIEEASENNFKLNSKFKVIMATYSVLGKPYDKQGQLQGKIRLLQSVGIDDIIILDEAHNAAGQSNTFEMMTNIVSGAKGVAYVSATYAKRPDNMPLYALKTSLKESYLSNDQMIVTFANGGRALQELVASVLSKEGQLLRREKEFNGDTAYMYESDQTNTGRNQINKLNQTAENWQLIRDFSDSLKAKWFEKRQRLVDVGDIEKEEKKNFKYKGKVERHAFRLFNYFLLSIKVRQASEEAISQMRGGKKVIFALANTLESAFDNIKKNYITNSSYNIGDEVPNDFNQVLSFLLSSTLRFGYETESVDDEGEVETSSQVVSLLNIPQSLRDSARNGNDPFAELVIQMEEEFLDEFKQILRQIQNSTFGVPLSPIDQIKKIISEAGFKVEEVTGRSRELVFNNKFYDAEGKERTDFTIGTLSKRLKKDRNLIVADFNSNKTDCLIINQTGATGMSMHSVPTKNNMGKIVPPVDVVPDTPPISLEPKNEVKQRCMIIVQMELDINKEVQKLGRINRTGQAFPPIYRYIVSCIPSEARLTAMMEKKLKSLMSNVSGDQEQGKDLFKSNDFFAREAVVPFNETLKFIYNNPGIKKASKEKDIENGTKKLYFINYDTQLDFWQTFERKLNDYIADLHEKGLYFGALQYKQYFAKTIGRIPYILGNNESLTIFGKHTFAELNEVTIFENKQLEADIEKVINSHLYITRGSETYNFSSNINDFVERATEYANETKNYWVSFKDGKIQESKTELIGYETDKEAILVEAKKFANLEKILELEDSINNAIEENEKIKKSINQLFEEGKIEEAGQKGKTLQSLATTIRELNSKLKKELGDYESGKDFQYAKKDLERRLNRLDDSIVTAKNNIESNNNDIKNEEELFDSYISLVNNIGKIFDYSQYEEIETDEKIMYEEEELFKLNYLLQKKQEVVLVGVNFNFNNTHFTKGNIELTFALANQEDGTISTNLSKLSSDNFSDKNIARGKKPMMVFEAKDIDYVGYWNDYLSRTNVGTRKNKVFLSGNILKGIAYSNITEAQGNLVKYNTEDNKLRVSIELGEESANKVMPRFNDGIDKFAVMFGLTEDNIKRLFVPMMNNSTNKIFATELIISQYTYLVAYKNNTLERYSDITSDDVKSLSFYIVSQTESYIQGLENICQGIGGDNSPSDAFCMEESDSMKYNIAVFSERYVPSTDFSSPTLQEREKFTFYQGVDGGKFDGIYLITNSVDSSRQYSSSQNKYFDGLVAITMNYNMLIGLLGHITKMGLELPAVTSKFAIDNSNPPYTWDIDESATGVIIDENEVSIDNVGVNLVQSIDDITNELVKFFQNI